jgi:UDP-N-acetylmuramate dehydrogenase
MENARSLIIARFPDLVEAGIIRFDEPLSQHCSFRIGGPAEFFCEPQNIGQLIALLDFTLTNRINYFILGKGSNLLISDKGLDGLVVSTSNLNKLSHDDTCLSAWCGASLKDLCGLALELGLTGLEFASGIPGSVGGAVFMNAGAYGGEIKDALYCSKYLIPDLDNLRSVDPVKHLKAEQHRFSYRRSIFQSGDFIHLSSVFRLRRDDPLVIAQRMQELEQQRWARQPMDLPSAGSVFKRPEGFFTGKLVDDCGLRGFQIGGAAVSDKHCGFIVNLGGATAADVLAVIRHVQKEVFDRFGVRLETELRLIGEA